MRENDVVALFHPTRADGRDPIVGVTKLRYRKKPGPIGNNASGATLTFTRLG